MGATVFYLASTALALYALWLLVFRTYLTDDDERPTDKRAIFPNIVYLLLFVICFIPILNVIFLTIFVVIALFGQYVAKDFWIKSWLFDKQKQKEEGEEGKE